MSRTVSCRIPKELHELLSEHCNKEGMTINDYIKDAIDKMFNYDERLELLLEEKNQKIRHLEARPANYEDAFLHIKDCNRCKNAIIDSGQVLVSLEELKKHNLVPVGNPVDPYCRT